MNLRKILMPVCAVLVLCGCIKNGDNEECLQGKYLYFQTIMPKYNYENIVDRLEVFLYDQNDVLVYNELYSRSELAANRYMAYIPEQAEGEYTCVTMVNFQEEYSTDGRQSLRTLKSSLLPGTDTVRIVQADSYQTRADLTFHKATITSKAETDTLDLSKNTNRINVTVKLNGFDLPEDYDIDINLAGNNGAYDYFENRNADNSFKVYMPVLFSRSTWTDPFCFSTMRVAVDDDLMIYLNVYDDQEGVTTRTIKLSEQLAKIEDVYGQKLYDTNDKLELEDEFNITVTLDTGYIVASVTINGFVIIELPGFEV